MTERFIDVVRRTRFSLSSYILFKVHQKSLGDWSGGGTPGYIPNPAVKAASADGTWGATPRESRSLPRDFFLLNTPRICKKTGESGLTIPEITIRGPVWNRPPRRSIDLARVAFPLAAPPASYPAFASRAVRQCSQHAKRLLPGAH